MRCCGVRRMRPDLDCRIGNSSTTSGVDVKLDLFESKLCKNIVPQFNIIINDFWNALPLFFGAFWANFAASLSAWVFTAMSCLIWTSTCFRTAFSFFSFSANLFFTTFSSFAFSFSSFSLAISVSLLVWKSLASWISSTPKNWAPFTSFPVKPRRFPCCRFFFSSTRASSRPLARNCWMEASAARASFAQKSFISFSWVEFWR